MFKKAPDKERVLAALRGVSDPVAGGDILSNGTVSALELAPKGQVRFVMEIPPGKASAYEAIKAEAESALRTVGGVRGVQIVMTAHSAAAAEPPPPPPRVGARGAQMAPPQRIPGVKRIVAIASGKGGVGKSTLTANLACALAARAVRTGLLDADVYGPSQPQMMGVSGAPEMSEDGKRMLPRRNHGVVTMSMGLMLEPGQAAVWRGPMLMKALQQMMMQVEWGALDVLLVDLPPGTGDVQLTLGQRAVVDGAIIVSTPQDVALIDALKAIDLFRRIEVPILGMVENMSTHVCSQCGHEEHIFGRGGVAKEAARLGVPLLAEIPLDLGIRLAADEGEPIVARQPSSPQARAFDALAEALISALGV